MLLIVVCVRRMCSVALDLCLSNHVLYKDIVQRSTILSTHNIAPNFGKSTSSQPLVVQLAKLCNSYFLKGGGGAGGGDVGLTGFYLFLLQLATR